jgi:hypothetical protein
MPPLWLKAVPWSAIIANAPLIVDGAKKLASLVRTSPSAPADVASPQFGTKPHVAPDVGALDVRLHALEVQQAETAELLRALADNNAEMARALDALRQRSKLTLRIAVAAAIVVVVVVAWLAAH